jgi:hypothetical protein
MTSSANPNKQVIYVDVDDEITGVIDKINASSARVIALVLPKRAAVFQSVVNMKLLKRRADNAKKRLVLITSEAGLMPLAGLAGLHVAATLQSKPEIPADPTASSTTEAADEADDGQSAYDEDLADVDNTQNGGDFDAAKNAAVPVGALATRPSMAGAVEDTVELDNTKTGIPGLKTALPSALGTSAKKIKQAKNGSADKGDKKLKVPNFFSFRKRLMLGALLVVLLGVGWYYAYVVLPKATVTITTNSTDFNSVLDLSFDTSATKVDTAKLIVPAQTKQEQKSSTQTVAASGQQNKGNKATGSVTMSIPCSSVTGDPVKVPAGTGLSSGGLVFITQTTVELSTPAFSGGCKFTGSTNVIAEKAGTSYNVGPSSFTVSGYPSVQGSSSTAMSGGTDNNVKVVQQSDIDAAKQKLTAAQDQNSIKNQLQQELKDANLIAVTSTFNTGTPTVNASSNVGDEADNVTVTQATTYTMFGVHRDDLAQIVEASVNKQIDQQKQSILNNGVDDARYGVQTPGAGPQLKVSMTVTSTAGPKLDIEALKQEMSGLKSGEVRDKLKQHLGVKDASVKYSPFWVSKAPKASRITVVFQKSAASDSSDGSSGADSGQ